MTDEATTVADVAALVDRQRKALAEIGHWAADCLFCIIGPDGGMRLVSHEPSTIIDDDVRKALSIDPEFEIDLPKEAPDA